MKTLLFPIALVNSILGNPRLATSGEQLVWFRRLGYVRVRDLVRCGTLAYVLLTALVTLLTSDLFTLVFLGVIAVVVLKLASIDRYFSPRRRVSVSPEGDLFIAEHVGTGTVRHGGTPEEALTNLDDAFTPPLYSSNS